MSPFDIVSSYGLYIVMALMVIVVIITLANYASKGKDREGDD